MDAEKKLDAPAQKGSPSPSNDPPPYSPPIRPIPIPMTSSFLATKEADDSNPSSPPIKSPFLAFQKSLALHSPPGTRDNLVSFMPRAHYTSELPILNNNGNVNFHAQKYQNWQDLFPPPLQACDPSYAQAATSMAHHNHIHYHFPMHHFGPGVPLSPLDLDLSSLPSSNSSDVDTPRTSFSAFQDQQQQQHNYTLPGSHIIPQVLQNTQPEYYRFPSHLGHFESYNHQTLPLDLFQQHSPIPPPNHNNNNVVVPTKTELSEEKIIPMDPIGYGWTVRTSRDSSKIPEDPTSSVPDPPYRKKTFIACNCCRKRKIKCSGAQPACERCVRRSLECVYQDTRRPRGMRKMYSIPTEAYPMQLVFDHASVLQQSTLTGMKRKITTDVLDGEPARSKQRCQSTLPRAMSAPTRLIDGDWVPPEVRQHFLDYGSRPPTPPQGAFNLALENNSPFDGHYGGAAPAFSEHQDTLQCFPPFPPASTSQSPSAFTFHTEPHYSDYAPRDEGFQLGSLQESMTIGMYLESLGVDQTNCSG